MAEDPTVPLLNLTAEEKRLFSHLFRQADSENIGVVTGEAAVKFFEKTKIEPQILGEIWQIADKENRGLLTPAGFGIVLRLVGHYQSGRDPTPELALRPGPPPRFENLNIPGLISTTKQSLAPQLRTLEPQVSGPGSIRVPPLTPDKAAQYAALFENSGAIGGILTGEQAKQVFERTGLPNEILGRIWSLADTEQKGALETTEFVIAMHLIASLKKGQMRSLPHILPPGLYEAALRRATGRSVSGSAAISSVPRQHSGSSSNRTIFVQPSQLASQPTGSSSTRAAYVPSSQLSSQPTGANSAWLITPSDQMIFDSIFKSIDKENRGFITGDQAVPFFCKSKLPDDALAQIWDLADINSAGRLSREEFAVAMYLIRMQRSKRDGMDSLPNKLPTNLVPPSMRNQTRPESVGTIPNFDTLSPVLPRSAAEDLFGLDALSPPITTIEKSSQKTGGTTLSTYTREPNTGSHVTRSLIPESTPSSNLIKPFIPASSFGQALSQQVTGGPKNSGSLTPKNLSTQKSLEDLLGDTDAEISKMLTSETAELANLSNQVSSLSKQAQELEGQRVNFQNDLTQSTTQKVDLEARLAQARHLYEQESKDVQNLRENLVSIRNETKKLCIEFETLESKAQNLRKEHSETIKAIRDDQRENSNLKERISCLNSEIAQLKTILENVTLDAKQQKGLVAINKKQLVTIEDERDRLKSQAEELNLMTKEDSVGPTISSVQTPASDTNPASSTSATTNPFFRRIESNSENPFSKLDTSSAGNQQSEKLLKNLFTPPYESFPSSDIPLLNPEQESTSDNFSKTIPSFPHTKVVSQELPKAVESPHQHSASQQLGSGSFSHTDSRSINSSVQNFALNYNFDQTLPSPNIAVNNGKTPESSIPPKLPPRSDPSENFNETSNSSISVSGTVSRVPSEEPRFNALDISKENLVSKISATDPFTPKALEPTRTVKDDFDSAFASFKSTSKFQEYTTIGGSSGSGSAEAANIVGLVKEFPPIAELGDDGSDSSSEGIGFEDDFATAPSASDKNVIDNSNIVAESSKSEIFISRTNSSFQDSAAQASSSSLTDRRSISESDTALPGSLSSKKSQTFHRSTTISESYPESIRNVSTTDQSGIKKLINSSPASHENPLDDDFNEFDDLEDAEEGDSNDEFAKISATDQSPMSDIHPMFDKSLPNKDVEIPQQYLTRDPSQLVDSKMQTVSTLNDRHNWDSIFSDLDKTDASLACSVTEPPYASKTSTSIIERSQDGEATTDSDPQDDPQDDLLLKKLTEMGYRRAEALVALEKFDYNLDKAADFLAS